MNASPATPAPKFEPGKEEQEDVGGAARTAAPTHSPVALRAAAALSDDDEADSPSERRQINEVLDRQESGFGDFVPAGSTENRWGDIYKDPLSEMVGDPIFYQRKTFEWAVLPFAGRAIFSRYYPNKHVIIDIFKRDSESSRNECLQKIAILAAYNKEQKDKQFNRTEEAKAAGEEYHRIGYYPMVQGQTIQEHRFKAALDGKITRMPERVTLR